MSDDQIALVAHIKSINEKTREWVKSNPGSWAGTLVEDADFWAQDGIFTVAEWEHSELCSTAYDMHKNIWGFKLDYSKLKLMTNEQLKEMIASLSVDYARHS